MIHSRLPQHVAAAHAFEAHQYVLERIVERVADMQRSGHVGGRDDNGIGFGPVPGSGPRPERVCFFPESVDSRLDGGRVVSFVKHHQCPLKRKVPV